MLQQETCRRFD